jgi:peptide-methionine (R)-S-oxide reductase
MDTKKVSKKLTEDQLRVLRDKGTEAPFSGEHLYREDDGVYTCAACDAEIFGSNTKFEAHCGWPSFYDVMDVEAIRLVEDKSHGMSRVEVTCRNCGGHLGHVFNDAPDQPTGIRYCINSVSLDFKPDKT